MTTPRAILIAGPTASGKSALALAIAARHGGVVINADSMQVYRELEILTARPGAADLAQARHELYGYISGGEPYSVGRWLDDTARLLSTLEKSGTLAIIVGGTGLYFKALLEGLSPIPRIAPDIRAHWRDKAARLGAASLHAELASRDPATAARLHPTDPQRLTRALEVLDATGRSLTDWQQEKGNPLLAEQDTVRLVVMPDRNTLIERANSRLRAMMATGALQEVENLLAKRYSPELPVMRALGVRPLAAAIAGDMDLETAVELTALETRQYIKRQATWLRRHMISWRQINSQQMESIDLQDFTFR